jgi:hypothetical protein
MDTLAIADPGDETSRRYRYQWIWAAVECCRLLDDTDSVEEVFCEHHEDVLLKHKNGLYSGCQIKTRDDDQPLWKAKDEAVLKSWVRFTCLEAEFPERFLSFRFLTNHPILNGKNTTSLYYILSVVKESKSLADVPPPVQNWLKLIAEEADVDISIVYKTIFKTDANCKLPKLRDATLNLINTISQCWRDANRCSYGVLIRVANKLIDECNKASSLDHEQLMAAYLLNSYKEDEDTERIIEGKRMTLSRVVNILEQGKDYTASLSGDPSLYIKPGSGSTDLLHAKLDTAGFSIVSRNSAEDLRDKADYLGVEWIKKYGQEEGLKRYDHINSLVLSDAGRAFDASQEVSDNFGPAMREVLRQLFRERRAAGYELYDASDDHLEGFAFSQTSQCKIVWSIARPWEGD